MSADVKRCAAGMTPGGQTVPENFAKSIEFSVHRGVGDSLRSSLDRSRIRLVDKHEVLVHAIGIKELSNSRLVQTNPDKSVFVLSSSLMSLISTVATRRPWS